MFMEENQHQFLLCYKKKFDHGTKNEVNETTTLISTIVPAYLPACYCFYEVGPAFVHSPKEKNC